MQICTWSCIYHWTKKLWKIRTGSPGRRAIAGRRPLGCRGPWAAGPSGCRAAGPWQAVGHWAAGLLLAKPGKSTGSELVFIRVLRLRKTSDFVGNLQKWSCRLQNSRHCQDKNLTLTSQKKLAGIIILIFCVKAYVIHTLLLYDWSVQQTTSNPQTK